MDQKEILENTNFIVAPLTISLLEHRASVFAGLNTKNTHLWSLLKSTAPTVPVWFYHVDVQS